ncbi:hypothetical protein ACIBL3_28425 [Kribbella sp. NPDC050124]|uniref:hypothetical protein n=1 Tax=Kribbella sp. NPDC050124 TaxID=3364114 RepID=UPI00378D8754
MKIRIALAATGVGLGLWGLWLLLDALEPPALLRLPLWLGGAVLADDFVLVPLTLAVGWLLTRRSGLGTIRTTLTFVGLTTLIATPLLLRQGTGVNPTVLPRNYLRDWLLLEAALITVGLIVFAAQRFTLRRSRASSGDMGGR